MSDDAVRLGLASPDDIRAWSSGAIREAADLLDGRAGMRHIELTAPVVHPLFFQSRACPLGLLLGMRRAALRRVIYFQDALVSDPGTTPLRVDQQLTHDELLDAQERYEAAFAVESGATAIRTLLQRLDLPALAERLRGRPRTERVARRLRLVEDLLASGQRPEWLVLETLPVVASRSGDLPELYRRIVLRNCRLQKLRTLNAPDVIVRCERRMLQHCVDGLFDNASCRRPLRSWRGNRQLKSLMDGLESRLERQGKRVDYSARSVLVPGPDLQLHQCGLPRSIARELYQPFLLRKLVELDHANNVESAWQLLARNAACVDAALAEVVRHHPVLLSRPAPRDRLGVQAFAPVLIAGQAIQLHPLVCRGFNARFDGSQVAVHLPLSSAAQVEATVLLMSTSNLFSPANGNLVVGPTQDIVLGCYHLTATPGASGAVKRFASVDDVLAAHAQTRLSVHARIEVRVPPERVVFADLNDDRGRIHRLERRRHERVTTTVGRVLFNDILPEKMAFYDLPMTSKHLARVLADCHDLLGRRATVELLDRVKGLGFREATRSGISLGMGDLRSPTNKARVLAEAEKEVEKFRRLYDQGTITERERFNKCIDIWTQARDRITAQLAEELRDGARPTLQPLYLMVHSGACGGMDQIRRLAGMGGLIAKPNGSLLETPITASFAEGLGVLEYFLSLLNFRGAAHARDRREKAAQTLTRKLVRAAQDAIVTLRDCGTTRGIPVRSVLDTNYHACRPLADVLRGRVSRTTIRDPYSEAVVVAENEVIGRDTARAIEQLGLEPVLVRSPLTCAASRGLCQLCYGADPATGTMVEIGTAVGVLAAQSLSEPGAQLMLRRFRIGGGWERDAGTTRAKQAGVVRCERLRVVVDPRGRRVALSSVGQVSILHSARVLESWAVPHGAELAVAEGERVRAGQVLFTSESHNVLLLAEVRGIVRYEGIVEGQTLRRERDPVTNQERWHTVEIASCPPPRLLIVDEAGQTRQGAYVLPESLLLVRDGETVTEGTRLAQTARHGPALTSLIGGLPRVVDLLEARQPHNRAALAEVAGRVRLGVSQSGRMLIHVQPVDGSGVPIGPEVEHHVRTGSGLRVGNGDTVRAGDPLVLGEADPRDLLRILGPDAVRRHLAQELQALYALQRVDLDDRHIEVIVARLVREVRPGEYRLVGITQAARERTGFLTALLAGDVRTVLADGALRSRVDRLDGVTANALLGRLIPVGTGFRG